MHQVLLDFLDRLWDRTSEAEVGAALLALFKELGADGGNIWFAVAEAKDQPTSVSSVNSVTDYTEEYMDVLYRPDLIDAAEIPRIIERSQSSYRYSYDTLRHCFGDEAVDTVQAKAAKDLMGMNSSLIIPVPTVDKQGSSGVSFFSSLDTDQFDALLREKGLVFAYAGHAAHIRMQQLKVTVAGPAVSLTKREVECLLWVSRGMRVKQVAHQLRLSDVTIEMHLKNARTKLNAQTLPEAVVKAVMVRLIAP